MNVLLSAFPLGLLQCDAKMKAFGPILPRPEPQRCLEDSDLAIYRAEGAYRLQRGNQDAPEVDADEAGLTLPVCTPRGYPAPADKLVQRSFSGRS